MKRITRTMAQLEADSDSDGVELITQEEFIHSTKMIVTEDEISIPLDVMQSKNGHAKLPKLQESTSTYIPCQMDDVLYYEPKHSLRTMQKYFEECKQILKKRRLGRWEKEFLMKLLTRKKQDLKGAVKFVEQFKERFDEVIQKGREEEGRLVLIERFKQKV